MVVKIETAESRIQALAEHWGKKFISSPGNGCPRLTDAHGERRLACLVWCHRRNAVAQSVEKVDAGYYRNMSEYTVHCSFLQISQKTHADPRPPPKAPVMGRWARGSWSKWSTKFPRSVWSIWSSFCGMYWNKKSDPQRPHHKTYRTWRICC